MKLAAQVIDLTKFYDLGSVVVKALRGVSTDFPEGDFVAIMGSSGSGKSTMLNLLGALDRPTSGQYILGGRDVSTLDDDELSEMRNDMIGFIFQSFNLITQYTVLENIEVPLLYRAGYPAIGRVERNGAWNWPAWSGSVIAWITALSSCPGDSNSGFPLPVR